jgi:lysophospholipase L1-like esterase
MLKYESRGDSMPGKIVCLGDSLTYGYPYGPHASWVTYVSKACGLSFSNAGINGNTIEDMAARFERDVLAKKPETVVILGGTNDACQEEVSCAMSVFFLEQMVASALANKILPVVGIPIPIDDHRADPKLERLSRECLLISSRLGASALDFRTPFIDPDTKIMRDNLYLDGVHPNLDGYRVMGEVSASFFQALYSAPLV